MGGGDEVALELNGGIPVETSFALGLENAMEEGREPAASVRWVRRRSITRWK
jgi:hypothetical protein